MAFTNYYCTTQDVIDRLTVGGVLFGADPTGQGSVSDPIVQTVMTEGLQEAGRKIDRALQPTWIGPLPLTQDDGNSPVSTAPFLNTHLRGWARTIATYYVATNGFKGAPESLEKEFTLALDDLKLHQMRKLRIPNLTYPGDGFLPLRQGTGRPRVANGVQTQRGSQMDQASYGPYGQGTLRRGRRFFGGPW